jgi:hypothetical protein
MERCPVCRAQLSEAPQCRRCGTDWTLVLKTESLAEQHVKRAARHLAQGDINGAKAAVEQALSLKRTPFSLALHAFISQTIEHQARNLREQRAKRRVRVKLLIP